MIPTANQHDVLDSFSLQSRIQGRDESLVTTGMARNPDHINVLRGRPAYNLRGVAKQRRDIDAKTPRLEHAGEDLHAPIVTVLTELREQDPRRSSLAFGKSRNFLADARNASVRSLD